MESDPIPKIESSVLMYNYFYYNPNDSLDTRKLKILKGKIAKSVKENYIFDTYNDSIILTLKLESHLFRWQKEKYHRDRYFRHDIVRANDSDRFYTPAKKKSFNRSLKTEHPNLIKVIENMSRKKL